MSANETNIKYGFKVKAIPALDADGIRKEITRTEKFLQTTHDSGTDWFARNYLSELLQARGVPTVKLAHPPQARQRKPQRLPPDEFPTIHVKTNERK